MNLSKTASYSLNILSYMAAHDEKKMSATFLNKTLHIPYPYLRQILSNLSKYGFIHSTRGRNGGFIFNRSTDTIYLADILEATDGMESFYRCILGFQECPFDNQCAMHTVWENTRNNIIKILKETSLKDISQKRI
jgi:Rrf2 family protein